MAWERVARGIFLHCRVCPISALGHEEEPDIYTQTRKLKRTKKQRHQFKLKAEAKNLSRYDVFKRMKFKKKGYMPRRIKKEIMNKKKIIFNYMRIYIQTCRKRIYKMGFWVCRWYLRPIWRQMAGYFSLHTSRVLFFASWNSCLVSRIINNRLGLSMIYTKCENVDAPPIYCQCAISRLGFFFFVTIFCFYLCWCFFFLFINNYSTHFLLIY